MKKHSSSFHSNHSRADSRLTGLQLTQLWHPFNRLARLRLGKYEFDWKLGSLKQRGDTIVEVIIVTAILGLVLAGSYSLTSHSLQNGIESNLRTEALSFAQQQAEYIKDAYRDPAQSALLSQYKGTYAHFCIISPQAVPPVADASNPSSCTPKDGIFIDDTYSGDTNSQIFTVTASWDSSGGGKGQVQLYYKTAL